MKFDNKRLVYNSPKLLKDLTTNIIKLKTLIRKKIDYPESR